MAEIDLIPADYRYWIWQLTWLKRISAAVIAGVIALSVTTFYLNQRGHKVNAELEKLQLEKAINQQQRQSLEALMLNKAELERQWNLLNGLRGGTTVENILVVIDRALNQNDIWFNNWHFNRAGVVVDKAPDNVGTGYFIVVPNTGKNVQGMPETWKISTHITIRGGAVDHAAFSGFVQRLIAQPEIADVKIIKTSLVRVRGVKIVDFDLSILVNNGVETT